MLIHITCEFASLLDANVLRMGGRLNRVLPGIRQRFNEITFGLHNVSVRPTPSPAFPQGRDFFEISGLQRLPVSRKEFFQVMIGVVHDPPQHIL